MGSVVGPLVVAGVSLEPDSLDELNELGVRDSKALTPERRGALYPEILKLSRRVSSVPIPPAEIDEYVGRGRKYRRLNFLEAIHMARVIDGLGAEKVFVDAPDVNPKRFAKELSALLSTRPRIVAEHRADSTYVVVSAASIVAKVERDAAVERLRRRHGDFGSGYPSDPGTISFLREWVSRNGSSPDFTRRSWKTWDRVLAQRLL